MGSPMTQVLPNSGMGGYNIGTRSLYTQSGGLRSSDTEALKCGLCFNVLRDPVQLITCGCRYCNTCVQGLTDIGSRYLKGCAWFSA